jgi:hypothetical protein
MHGYSSSEESEDPRRPRTQPVAPSSSDQKKPKKKKPPPQHSINRIWKKFQNKRFNKALAILPFDPVPPAASPERGNELLSDGYERAAEECRRKVRKIIQECRRVNMRYRDPGFDLVSFEAERYNFEQVTVCREWSLILYQPQDWDLKYEKGHCLNSLGQQKFELNKSNIVSPSSAIPKAVKRIHEIYEKPTFMKNASGNDVKQGNLGDCWLVASLTALAAVEDGIKRTCVEYDTR